MLGGLLASMFSVVFFTYHPKKKKKKVLFFPYTFSAPFIHFLLNFPLLCLCEMLVRILNINSTILSSTIDTVGTYGFGPYRVFLEVAYSSGKCAWWSFGFNVQCCFFHLSPKKKMCCFFPILFQLLSSISF